MENSWITECTTYNNLLLLNKNNPNYILKTYIYPGIDCTNFSIVLVYIRPGVLNTGGKTKYDVQRKHKSLGLFE